MIETRHGLESNPVRTTLLPSLPFWGPNKDVGTGLDSRPCLVSIIFADLPSLHPPSFDFYIYMYLFHQFFADYS